MPKSMDAAKQQIALEIQALQEELDVMNKTEKFKEPAEEVFVLKTCLVDAGFTEDQAMQILIALLQRMV